VKNKLSILAVVGGVFLLSSCGGSSTSSDSTETTDTDTSSTSIQVIDGYIDQADVYLDRDGDGVADDDEYLGTTDSSGELTTDEDIDTYGLIANVNAGQAADADRVGPIAQSYQLTAAAGTNIVTPYSTLAQASDYTLSDLADYLNLYSTYVSGDYVALQDTNNSNRAIKTQAVARSLTWLLADQGSLSLDDALAVVDEVDTYLNDYDYSDLDTVTLQYDADETTVISNYADMEDYLTATNLWYTNSLNTSSQQDDGEQTIEFDSDSGSFSVYDNDGELIETRDYLIDGTSLISTGNNTAELLGGLPDFALFYDTLTDQLTFWSATSYEYPFDTEFLTSTDFSGETWYLVSDISASDSADISVQTLTFSTLDGSLSGTVTGTEDDEVSTGSYYVTTIDDDDLGLVAPLYLQWDDSENSLVLVNEASGVHLMYDLSSEQFMLMTQDENFANYLNTSVED
jgi:hypothetical protein